MSRPAAMPVAVSPLSVSSLSDLARPISQQALGPMEVTTLDHLGSTLVNDIDRERAWVALVGRALGRAMKSQKAAAGDLGIGEGLLSAQLACAPNKHLSFRRMFYLGPVFWRELVALICEFHDIAIGQSVQDRTDMEVGRLVREVLAKAAAR